VESSHVMVILIVAIVMIASVLRARYTSLRKGGGGTGNAADEAENRRLREEVAALKDRLAVLERITVEKENSLAREIEQLRDR
jgi:hypothetical protein